MRFIIFFLLISCAHKSVKTYEGGVKTFEEAKSKLRTQVYHDHRRTFYCDEDFDAKLNLISQRNFKPMKLSRRSRRIEWEHVVPAENFGRSFVEWREGDPSCERGGRSYRGRKCARAKSKKFREMEGDPYNLVPAIGEVNKVRSNYRYAELPGALKPFGTCDFKLEGRRVEPRAAVKGDIARIYFYMEETYGIKLIADAQEKLFAAWNNLDPIDEWECTRVQRIRRFHPDRTKVWSKCR